MIRLVPIVLALQLQVAELQVVTFDLCFLDFQASPEELRPDPQGRRVNLVVSQITGWGPMPSHYAGIDCAKIKSRSSTVFVVGSPAAICAKLGVHPANEACKGR